MTTSLSSQCYPLIQKKSVLAAIVTLLVIVNAILLGIVVHMVFAPTYQNLYQPAVSLAMQDKMLISQLGAPLKASWLPAGFRQSKAKTSFRFTITGSKGQADVFVKAVQQKTWEIREVVAFTPSFSQPVSFLMIKYDQEIGKERTERELSDWVRGINNTNASYVMAEIYRGLGYDEKSAQAYQKAVDQGSAYAANNLAIAYLDGRGVEKDAKKALALYQKAADQGDEVAMYNLGFYYFKMAETPDYALAAKWYERSIETQTNSCALNDLGILYAAGKGVKQNTEKAENLLREAGRLLLLGDSDFYYEIMHTVNADFLKTRADDILDAFVEYQYYKETQGYLLTFEEDYSLEVAELAKTMSDKLVSRCWA